MSVLERVRQNEQMESASVREHESMRTARDRLKRDLVESLGLSAVASMATDEDTGKARSEISVACQAILNSKEYRNSNLI